MNIQNKIEKLKFERMLRREKEDRVVLVSAVLLPTVFGLINSILDTGYSSILIAGYVFLVMLLGVLIYTVVRKEFKEDEEIRNLYDEL